MCIHNLFHRKSFCIAVSISCILAAVAPAPGQSDISLENVTAVSGIATGNVQEVGFRAMIQKKAIEYNLAGKTENNKDDKSVRFTLQGAQDRIDQTLKAIHKGTHKSSNVNVSASPASVNPDLKTFTIVGWTSVSRHIYHPYDLVFDLRPNNTTIKKDEAKEIWVVICTNTVRGEDSGKCNKDKDDDGF
jgi:acylphosphatase